MITLGLTGGVIFEKCNQYNLIKDKNKNNNALLIKPYFMRPVLMSMGELMRP